MWVRTAGPGDIGEIRALLEQSWHATYDGIYGAEKVSEIIDDWFSVDRLTDRLTQPNSEFVVSDSGEAILGVAFASASEKSIHLHQLYVHPDFMGQKLGVGLLIEIENAFPQCNEISLDVDPANSRAVKFYKSFGFEPSGTVENCGQSDSGIPAISMKKKIEYAEDEGEEGDLIFR